MVQEHAATGRAREEEVYRQYAPQVFTYLLRHVPTHQDAEDLLVEVFLAVLEKLPAFDPDEQRLGTYVQMIVLLRFVNGLRSRDYSASLKKRERGDLGSATDGEHAKIKTSLVARERWWFPCGQLCFMVVFAQILSYL